VIEVKSYFDGSEIAGRCITLAGLATDVNTWSEVEGIWEEVRKTRGNPPYVHMTDLMALEGIYKHWEADARDYLVDGLLNVLLSFRGHPRLRSFTCSVNLGDYARLRQERSLPPPDRLCARLVFPHVMNWHAELPGLEIGRMEAYFDRNEKFMRHIEPDWRSKKTRKKHPQWELVSSISQASMKNIPALQMTDVVAWGRNRLTSGSHWETDLHYATAVRACGSLQGIHRPIDGQGLANFHYREEGYAAIDPQKRKSASASRSEEFKKFDRMMRELMHKSHEDSKRLPPK
jgi:hypothetical protein